AAALFSFDDAPPRRRLAITVSLAALFTMPFVLGILTLHGDQRSRLLLDGFLLPQRMLIKLDLTAAFANLANRIAPVAALSRPVFLAMATIVFLLVGPGVRWVGAPGVWRGIRGTADPRGPWRRIAWCAVT